MTYHLEAVCRYSVTAEREFGDEFLREDALAGREYLSQLDKGRP
jgi:hypothetical protein